MNKSEIASKIKNAIEEKLCLLGAYVDKELPEYILVMVANKKSREAMANDLQLFLGQETINFIDWLHDLLEKCQTNPEDAFRANLEKPPKSKSNHSPDKKQKKLEKTKQKVKTKSKKSDDKKDHKKTLNIIKSNKNRSRSPTKSEVVVPRTHELVKHPKPKTTPEKHEPSQHNHTPVQKREMLKVISENIFKNNSESELSERNAKEDTNIGDKPGSIETKIVTSIASVVKVTERPTSKKEIFKSSIEMVQRDLKEAEADISNKEPIPEKQSQRSSVFTRLGCNNDLRKTLLAKSEDGNNQKSTKEQLKRTIHKLQSEIDDDDDDDDDIESRESKQQRLENHSSSPNFIVTLKGVDKLNIPLISRLGPKRSQESMDSIEDEVYNVEVNDEDTISESVQDSKENNAVVVVESQLTRCRFWPSCKNKETCPFVHPTEPCKTFPICKYGALCMYIHPNCRYSNSCTKPECPYTHYGARIATNTKPAAHTLPRCVFYPNCTNVNCKFFHPNLPCKYGLSCKLKDSCMFYHPSMPKITDLKWTANQDVQNANIISANTKKPEIQTA